MTNKEINLLSHLKRATEYSDTYFCGISKNNKNKFIYTVEEQVKSWVENNGGIFKRLSDKKFMGNTKGFFVKIIFPSFNEMKQVMATI